MSNDQTIPTPMCDRLAASSAEREAILRFLDWCGERNLVLAELTDSGRSSLIYPGPGTDIVFRYLGIDVAELDRERRALLDASRERAAAQRQESAS